MPELTKNAIFAEKIEYKYKQIKSDRKMENYNVNPELIEEQEKRLTTKNEFKRKFEFDEKNYLNLRLNPGETSRQVVVRILPVSSTDGHPFLVLHTHSLKVCQEISKSGFKSFICLNDEHLRDDHPDGCPLCNKSEELLAECRKETDPVINKALYKSAMQFKPKQTFIARVIERGHENEGVKFWRFNAHSDGQGYYDQLMKLYHLRDDESKKATGEPYNIFDLINGKDIVISLSYDPNTKKTSGTIADSGFQTPLSKDNNKISEWVNDKKQWHDIYASKSFDYLKIVADGDIPFYNKETSSWETKKKEQSETVSETFDTWQKNAEATEETDLPF